MNDGEASRVFVGDDAEILNTPSWVDVQIKQIKLKDKSLDLYLLSYILCIIANNVNIKSAPRIPPKVHRYAILYVLWLADYIPR